MNLPKEKRRRGETEETLAETGQDSEAKAAKAIIELQKEAEKREKEKEATWQEELARRRKSPRFLEYKRKLAELLRERLGLVDWPRGYSYETFYNSKGVGLFFNSRFNRRYAQGISPTGDVRLDTNALHILATRAENTVDRLEGRLAWQVKAKEKGVILDKHGFPIKADEA